MEHGLDTGAELMAEQVFPLSVKVNTELTVGAASRVLREDKIDLPIHPKVPWSEMRTE